MRVSDMASALPLSHSHHKYPSYFVRGSHALAIMLPSSSALFGAIKNDRGAKLHGRNKTSTEISAQEDDRIISYIRNNPVRAGLVKRPEDWKWSQ